MSGKLDWNKARQRRPTRRSYNAADPAKLERFQQRYRAYVATQRAHGRQPLPPVQWIKELQRQARKGGRSPAA